jgi:hypothetical protein
LEDLLLLLKLIKESLDVVGLDIAGDYSFPKAKGIIKAICSSLDHPRDFSAKGSSLQRIDRINEETNIRILELLKC